MMKHFRILVFCVVSSLGLSAQNTGILQITLHRNLLGVTSACQLHDEDTSGVYIHSGVGYSSNTAAWEAIVGHWGLRDGLGEMDKVNDSTFTICMNIRNYYSQLASPDSLHGGEGRGPLPAGATPYNIGCVFRNPGPCPLGADGKPNCIKGADDACQDIFITNLDLSDPGNHTTPEVYDYNTNPFAAVEAVYVNGCVSGVKDISSELITEINVTPNPFSGNVKINFNMIPDLTKVTAQIYDVLGSKVADLSSAVVGGYNTLIWDGTSAAGNQLAAGSYVIKVSNGSKVLTAKIVKK